MRGCQSKGKVKSEDAPYNAPIILTAEDTIIWVIGTAKFTGSIPVGAICDARSKHKRMTKDHNSQKASWQKESHNIYCDSCSNPKGLNDLLTQEREAVRFRKESWKGKGNEYEFCRSSETERKFYED